MKIRITNPGDAMTYNAVTSDGEVVSAGHNLKYALSTSPKIAAFIVREDGEALAASVGAAWIPTRAGLDLVTRAADALVLEVVESDDGTRAWEDHVERFEPLDGE